MKLNTTLLLLTIFGYGQPAIVKISAPTSVVELGSNIKIEVVEISPNASNPSFDRLDCGAMVSGQSSHKTIIAQYDKHSMRFKAPSHGIPTTFKDKVSYVGNMSFVIHHVRFEDKFMKVVCILNYKSGLMTLHVDSPAYEIKVVYVSPSFYTSSTPSGTIEVRKGQRARIECTAKSWPQSTIYWESNITKSEFNITTTTSERNQEYIVTSTLILESPSSIHDGKNVICVVVAQYGRSLRRQFTLNYVTGDINNSKSSSGKKEVVCFLLIFCHFLIWVLQTR